MIERIVCFSNRYRKNVRFKLQKHYNTFFAVIKNQKRELKQLSFLIKYDIKKQKYAYMTCPAQVRYAAEKQH